MRTMKMLTVDLGLNYKHYAKDVGMIPYLLQKMYEWECKILGPKKIDNYIKPYDDYAVETIFPENVYNNDIKNIALYIKEHAREYDVLNLYHINTRNNLHFCNLFHKYNPNGIVYLKLDLGFRGLDMCKADGFLKRWYKKKLFHTADVISDENQDVCVQLSNFYKCNVDFVPNGWYGKNDFYRGERKIDFLYVGRIGIKEKGVDILLDAFAQMRCEANLHLVGKIEDSFLQEIEEWKMKHPKASKHVFFHGEIRDKKELNYIYDISKVLVIPSRWESFGIVLVEGLSHGCFILASSTVSAASSILNDNIGFIFESENSASLRNSMENLEKKAINREIIYSTATDYNWESIVEGLNKLLIEAYSRKSNHQSGE